MATENLNKNIQHEGQIARRLKKYEGIRNTILLESFDLQFENLDGPGAWAKPISRAEIREIIPSAAASEVIVKIEPLTSKSTSQEFVIVNVSNSINKLSIDQRHIIYCLIASCCRWDERPVVRHQNEVIEKIQEELVDFVNDLYRTNSTTYDNAERMLEMFNAKVESASREEAHW